MSRTAHFTDEQKLFIKDAYASATEEMKALARLLQESQDTDKHEAGFLLDSLAETAKKRFYLMIESGQGWPDCRHQG